MVTGSVTAVLLNVGDGECVIKLGNNSVVRPIPTHSSVPKYFEYISRVKQSFGKIYLWTFLSRLTGLSYLQ